MIRNFKLTIEYDGTRYHGWQIQKNARTIQGEIQKALETMLRHPVTLNGSGRTDAGVHAKGQTANFRCNTRLSAEIFQKGLNSLLDSDIVILDCREMHESFHARFDVAHKTYCYYLLNRPLPMAVGRQYVWHIRKPLDLAAMKQAARMLTGVHDFKSFEGAGSPRDHTVREIFKAEFSPAPEIDGLLVFEIQADGFLRFMVRNIVGTLVDTGLGKITPSDVEKILRAKDRSLASATAPPQGLFLVNVSYKEVES